MFKTKSRRKKKSSGSVCSSGVRSRWNPSEDFVGEDVLGGYEDEIPHEDDEDEE